MNPNWSLFQVLTTQVSDSAPQLGIEPKDLLVAIPFLVLVLSYTLQHPCVR